MKRKREKIESELERVVEEIKSFSENIKKWEQDVSNFYSGGASASDPSRSDYYKFALSAHAHNVKEKERLLIEEAKLREQLQSDEFDSTAGAAEWSTVPVTLPAPLKFDGVCQTFTISSVFHKHSGLLAQSNGDIVLYCRDAFHEQFRFISDQVIMARKLGWILGTPGTGKSSAAFAFLTTLDRDEWVITWFHLTRYGPCFGLRFDGDKKTTVLFSVTTQPQDLNKCLVAECGKKKHIVIIDGLVDTSDQIYISCCTLWFMENMLDRRLMVITSMATRLKCSMDDELLLGIEEHRVHSWAFDEFQVAAGEDLFFRTIEKNLDAGINAGKEGAGADKRTSRLLSKFHFSGGSCRYMFGYPTENVIKNISAGLACAEDITQYIQGSIGARSSNVVNRLIGSSFDRIKRTTTYSIVSDFAAAEIASRMGPDFIRTLATAMKSTGNPALTGELFEMWFFANLSHKGVNLIERDGNSFSWPKAECCKFDPESAGSVNLQPNGKSWFKPLKWNQGGYDAVFIDQELQTVIFVQVTTAHKHSFKLEYFWHLMDRLQVKIETSIIDIVFLVPSSQLESFSIRGVSGEGLLSPFKSPKGPQWGKGKEVDLVRIVGFDSM